MSRKKKEVRRIPSLNIIPLVGISVETLLQADQIVDFIYAETYIAIKEAIETKKTIATLFQINEQDSYSELDKSQWQSALDSCIKYYTKSERYELCSHLQSLKSKINSKKPQLV